MFLLMSAECDRNFAKAEVVSEAINKIEKAAKSLEEIYNHITTNKE